METFCSNKMKSAPIGLLVCLLILSVQGQQSDKSNKCKCSNSLLTRFSPKLIKAEPVVYQPSSFCPQTEIIITIKEGKEKCVDPKSPFGKFILKKKPMHREAGAAHLTTASAQTSTSNSTRCYTASR
uniref:Chemokine interleukin-8-like domain-containing protein n=1 Tax=Iconisemion striatum TaxID=60296 RepID=A0A1A7Z775_9TELE